MKKDYSLLISSIITTISYTFFVISMSVDNLMSFVTIGLLVYIVGITLLFVFTIKLSKNKANNITALTISTIMLFVSFFPLGIYWMWFKNKWNVNLKIVLSIFVPIIATVIFIAPLSNSSTPMPIEKTTTQAITTTETILQSNNKLQQQRYIKGLSIN